MERVTEYGSGRRRKQWKRAVVGIVAVGTLVAGGLVGYQLAFGESGQAAAEQDSSVVARADQHLRTFTRAWQAGEWTVAGRLTDSPESAASLLTSVKKNLKPESFRITVGKGKTVGEGVDAAVEIPFTVSMTVPQVGAYSYESKARIVETAGKPVIRFESSTVHPALRSGQTLAVAKQESRGSILDRNGDPLTASSLVGGVDKQTGEGISGLEERYDKQLAGTASTYAIAITDRQTGRALRPLKKAGTKAGQDVRTTIDPKVQQAAAAAIDASETPASLLAIRPSTGDILAVANQPGGYNRALVGEYPPGSTFKVVTAAALLESGLQPSDALSCPTYEWVNGFRFANQGEFSLSSGSTFRQAFARSCNTAFVNARDRIDNDTLAETAAAFGIGGDWDIGASSYDGSVPVSTNVNDKAASMIGQGRVLASPLVMASVAATVKSGRFVQPRLVPEGIKRAYEAPRSLDPQVVSDLRSMMRSVVTEGAGDALRGLPGRPHAKTGTAEFGEENPPRTHAWMIGYQEDSDLAWAVQMEDGGSGGADAGPIAAAFLQKVAAG